MAHLEQHDLWPSVPLQVLQRETKLLSNGGRSERFQNQTVGNSESDEGIWKAEQTSNGNCSEGLKFVTTLTSFFWSKHQRARISSVAALEQRFEAKNSTKHQCSELEMPMKMRRKLLQIFLLQRHGQSAKAHPRTWAPTAHRNESFYEC